MNRCTSLPENGRVCCPSTSEEKIVTVDLIKRPCQFGGWQPEERTAWDTAYERALRQLLEHIQGGVPNVETMERRIL